MAEVRLRGLTEEDLPDWVEWLNDPEVTRFTIIGGGATLEAERQWYAHVTAPDYPHQNWQLEAEGKHIGGASLVFDEAKRQGEFGIIIGVKVAWNKGYGTAVVREVLRRGFEEFGLHRIHLRAYAGNARAIHCYEKCGCRREGYHLQAMRKGDAWVDVVSMAILKDEWERREGKQCCRQ
jgi:hypothetical protein